MLLRRVSDFTRRLLSLPITAVPRDSGPLRPLVSGAGGCSCLYSSQLFASRWNDKHVQWGIRLAAQTAFVVGVICSPVLAEDSSIEESSSEKVQRDKDVISGLKRVDDGSIISNPHTIKWRIFTDNGRDLFSKGKLGEVEKFFLSALEEAKKGFGERDPHVASSLNNLAELYRVQKAFEKAEPLYLDAINILEEALGPDDVRVGAALHNLGQFYLVQRKLEEARTCYEIKGRVLGHGHTDYADTMYHFGTVLYLQGLERDAEALIQDSIRILEEAGLAESAICIRRMRYLSQVLLKSGQLNEAEALQRKILHLLEISKGWGSLDTVIASEQLALTLQYMGTLEEAQELMERCLTARKNIFHEDHVQVAANMLHLSRIAMLRSSQLRKTNISEARALIDKARSFLDGTMRIAKTVLNCSKENGNDHFNNKVPEDGWKDIRTALIILLQSLDAIGLLEVSKYELQGTGKMGNAATECIWALGECISLYRQEEIQNLLKYPDVRAEYLQCLRHLTTIVSDCPGDGNGQSRAISKRLKDEVKHIQEDLSSARKNRS